MNVYIIISIAIALADGILAVKSIQKNKTTGRYLGFACIGAAVVDISYLISILNNDYLCVSVMSSVYFINIDIMLICLLVFTYMLVAVILLLLIRKMCKIPCEYRSQYRYVIIGIVAIVAVNGVFLYWPGVNLYNLLDYSICGYSLTAFLLYWSCFEYSTHGMLDQESIHSEMLKIFDKVNITLKAVEGGTGISMGMVIADSETTFNQLYVSADEALYRERKWPRKIGCPAEWIGKTVLKFHMPAKKRSAPDRERSVFNVQQAEHAQVSPRARCTSRASVLHRMGPTTPVGVWP